jgi:hypothetical protein
MNRTNTRVGPSPIAAYKYVQTAGAPWAQAMEESLQPSLGSDQLGRLAAQMATRSRADKTNSAYVVAIDRWLDFLGEEGVDVWSAGTPERVMRFIARLTTPPITIGPATLNNYVGTIGQFYEELSLGNPTHNALVKRVRSDFSKHVVRIEDERSAAQRRGRAIPLSASLIMAMLRRAENEIASLDVRSYLLKPVEFDRLRIVRACLATFLAFAFVARASSIASLYDEDVSTDGALKFRVLKGKTADEIRQLPARRRGNDELQRRLVEVIAKFREHRRRYSQQTGKYLDRYFFALPGEYTLYFSENFDQGMTIYIREAVDSIQAIEAQGVRLPYTSHSCRRGAATAWLAMNPDDASMARFKNWGCWAQTSKTLEDKYVEYGARDSDAAHKILGWLRTN